jgi:hypothetical protein
MVDPVTASIYRYPIALPRLPHPPASSCRTLFPCVSSLILLSTVLADGLDQHTCSAQEIGRPTADELAREIQRRIFATPTHERAPRELFPAKLEEIAATIAWAYGPAAIPILDKAADVPSPRGATAVREVALIAVAVMSDAQGACEIIERRVTEDFPPGILYVTYMAPERRNGLAWKLFDANIGMRDPSAQRIAVSAALLLVEVGGIDRAKAVVTQLESPFLERRMADRIELERILGASTDLIEWKTVQLRRRLRIEGNQVLPGGTSAQGLPTAYCVARSRFTPSRGYDLADDYGRFCGQGAFWQALQDIDGVAEIAANRERPDELRHRAVRVLVQAPKVADDEGKTVRLATMELMGNALKALKRLANTDDADVRAWIAEEILADDKTREQHKSLMRALAGDQNVAAPLREKCREYADRQK